MICLFGCIVEDFKRYGFAVSDRIIRVNFISFQPDICFIRLDDKTELQLVLSFCRIGQSVLGNENSIAVKLRSDKGADIGSVGKRNVISNIHGANDEPDFPCQL